MADSAYVAALKMLARRELSEAQVRQRLARKQFPDQDIEEALARLKTERALDDDRVAAAIARSETGLRKRGPLRVRQRLAAAGIAQGTAERAMDEIVSQVDMDALLIAALEKRLDGGTIGGEREMARLFRQLTGQGFESDRVMRLLRKYRWRKD